MKIIAAALLYFAIVFAVGLVFGPIRVFWLEPKIGEVLAAICEAPFLVVAMVVASRWTASVLGVRRDLASLGLMGLGALAIQQGADLAVGIEVQRRPARKDNHSFLHDHAARSQSCAIDNWPPGRHPVLEISQKTARGLRAGEARGQT
ncbi:hypothetical protein ACF1BQ_021810 [Bradyrhizobium sp. RDT10]